MDTNTYEYQSYMLIRRRMKDRGAFFARLRRSGGNSAKLDIAVTTRKKYRLQRFFACVASGPFALPAPAAEQNNG